MTTTPVEGLHKLANQPISPKTAQALADSSQRVEDETAAAEVASELVKCWACDGAGQVLPSIPYRVILTNGYEFLTQAREEPKALRNLVRKARADHEYVLWGDGQFTFAEQIAHVEVDDSEEVDPEPTDTTEPEGEE